MKSKRMKIEDLGLISVKSEEDQRCASPRSASKL